MGQTPRGEKQRELRPKLIRRLMTEQRFYKVGGHTFGIDFQKGMLSEKELMPYAPFRTDFCSDQDLLFRLNLTEDVESRPTESQLLADLEDENGKMIIFSNEDGGLTFYISSISGHECCHIRISKDYHTASAWIGGNDSEKKYALDTTMMLLYTFASSKYETIMLHASVVECEGKGYIFLGKSGTGKSTHNRLWTENIQGAELLNDDNPIVRIINGIVYVYGSPWSGKTPCYRNGRVPVGGIVRLHQAPFNRITSLSGIKAYAALLPSCSCMKWNHEMAEAIHSTISKVIGTVPIYSLECLPNQEAALLCSHSIKVGTHGSCVREPSSTNV